MLSHIIAHVSDCTNHTITMAKETTTTTLATKTFMIMKKGLQVENVNERK